MQIFLNKTSFIFYSLFILFLLPLQSLAETRYVTDQLVISVRTGPGKNYKIIENIKTGTAMNVLEDKGDFLKVQVGDELTGWVPKYYTENKIPKEKIIKSLKLEIKRMEEEGAKQAARLQELEDIQQVNNQNLAQIETLTKQLHEIEAKHDALLAQSKDIIETIQERDELKKSASGKDQILQELQAENSSLKNYKMIYWFATGGGIFLLGWLIGKFSRKANQRSLTL